MYITVRLYLRSFVYLHTFLIISLLKNENFKDNILFYFIFLGRLVKKNCEKYIRIDCILQKVKWFENLYCGTIQQ